MLTARTFAEFVQNHRIDVEPESRAKSHILGRRYSEELRAFVNKNNFECRQSHLDWEFLLRGDDYDVVIQRIIDAGVNHLNLKRDWPYEDMLREAMQFPEEDRLVMNRENGWTGIPLYAYDEDFVTLKSRRKLSGLGLNIDGKFSWTRWASACPITRRWCLEDPLYHPEAANISFKYLEPGGFVPPHFDTLGREFSGINYALNNPEGCRWIMDDTGLLPFKQGTTMFLDFSFHHSVINLTGQTRVHMLRGGRLNKTNLLKLIKSSYLR